MANHLDQYRFRKSTIKSDVKFDYTKLIPLIIPTIVLFGILRLMLYYVYFNIDIIFFLDVSEILTSFFDVIFFIILGAISLVMSYFIADNYNRLKLERSFDKTITLNPKTWNWYV